MGVGPENERHEVETLSTNEWPCSTHAPRHPLKEIYVLYTAVNRGPWYLSFINVRIVIWWGSPGVMSTSGEGKDEKI